MQLTVLGSGTLVPLIDRGPAGHAVTVAGRTLLFDSGAGTLWRARRNGIAWQAIDQVFYSHYHPDHTLDLVSLLFASKYAPGKERQRPLYLYGPPGLEEFCRGLWRVWPAVEPRKFELARRELRPGDSVTGEGWRVVAGAVSHGEATANALCYRVEETGGKALVYSGDTEYSPGLVELCRGAELLVCECSTAEERRVEGHMTPSQVARVAQESGVPRVLLVHIYPIADPRELARQVADQCRAQVEPARDGLRMEV